MRRRAWAFTIGCICFLAATSDTRAQIYVLTDLGVDIPSGFGTSGAIGINSYGQVAGQSWSSNGVRSFLWTPDVLNGTAGVTIDLGEPPPGRTQVKALGINSFGQVTGSTQDNNNHGFLWTPTSPNATTGTRIDLIAPIVLDYAYEINSSGQVSVQGRLSFSNSSHAYLWTPDIPNGNTGTVADLGVLKGADFSTSWAINDYGQLVGVSGGSTFRHAFLWTPSIPNGAAGSMIDLGEFPGGENYSHGSDINSFGQVVGESAAPAGPRAFLWTPTSVHGTLGSMRDLGDLPGGLNTSSAMGVNASGAVVGYSSTSDGTHGFLWTEHDGMIDLNRLLDPNLLGWQIIEGRRINDFGQIVGAGMYDPDGPGGTFAVQHAVLLTPVVPEPEIVMLAGVAMIALLKRRKGGASVSRHRRVSGGAGNIRASRGSE